MAEYDGIRDRLNEEIESRKNHLAEGSCEDMTQYHRIVGQLEALRFCVALLGSEQVRQEQLDF